MTDENKGWAQRARDFFLHDVWDIDISSLSTSRSLPIRLVRVGQLVFKGFTEDDLAVHASALTFVTLMSLVPMLAVGFALLKGFGFTEDRINTLLRWTENMPTEFQAFVARVLEIVNTTNLAALGWVGLGVVVFTAVLVLGSAEVSFNRIWGVAKPRSLFRQIANYVSILVLVPLLIGVGSTVEATLRARAVMLPGSVGFVARNLLGLTSLFTTWLAFWFLYTFLPNTRVRVAPALTSSLLGALVWLAWQKAFISLQIGVARYNAIYGTFASVPIFLAWLYTGWVIILLGAELAFALQNSSTYQVESAADRASVRSRLILALSIVRRAAQALSNGEPRFEVAAYGREHRVPIRLLNDLVRLLVRAELLAETADKQGCYVLLKSPDALKVKDVVELVLRDGPGPERLGLARLDAAVEDVLKTVDGGLSQSLNDLTIRSLLKNG